MEPIILNYKSLPDLKEAIIDGSLPMDGPIITAYASVAEKLEGKIPCHVMYFNTLLPKLLGKWDQPNEQFKQLLLIYNCISDLSNVLTADEKRAALHNAGDILCTIRELVMMGIGPGLLPGDTPELRMIKRIYNILFLNEQSLIKDLLNRRKTWKDTFKNNAVDLSALFFKAKAIYLQGFCYITPRQAVIFNAMIDAGFQLYFLNHYEKGNLYYKIWEANKHFEGLKTEWVHSKDLKTPEKPEAYSYDSFDNIFEFVEHINAQNKPVTVLCPVDSNTNNMVDTFFRDEPAKDKLLGYPIGRYISTLYSMCTDGVRISIDQMKECIATGWGKGYTSNCNEAFAATSFFFTHCHTIEEWMVQISCMHKRINADLTKICSNSGLEKAMHFVYLRSHPIESSEMLFCIEGILKDLQLIANVETPIDSINHLLTLLKEKKAVSYKNNDYNWASIIEQVKIEAPKLHNKNDFSNLITSLSGRITSISKQPQSSPKEIGILDTFIQRLEYVSENFELKEKNVLPNAIQFILGGEKKEDLDPEGNYLHDVKVKNDHVKFQTIAEIEATLLQNSDTTNIVAFCDANHMPGGVRKYPWPLTPKIMKELEKYFKEKQQPRLAQYVNDFIFYRESFRLANRYRYYLATQVPNICLTWVTHAGNKEILPSPYLEIGKYNGNAKQLKAERKDEYVSQRGNDDCSTYDNLDEYDINIPEKYPGICRYRYLYSHKLGDHREFTNDFLISHYISILAAYLPTLTNGEIDWRKAEDLVYRFFNMLSNTEKANCIQFTKKSIEEEESPIMNLEILHKDKISHSNKCDYCPHRGYCLLEFKEFKDNAR